MCETFFDRSDKRSIALEQKGIGVGEWHVPPKMGSCYSRELRGLSANLNVGLRSITHTHWQLDLRIGSDYICFLRDYRRGHWTIKMQAITLLHESHSCFSCSSPLDTLWILSWSTLFSTTQCITCGSLYVSMLLKTGACYYFWSLQLLNFGSCMPSSLLVAFPDSTHHCVKSGSDK